MSLPKFSVKYPVTVTMVVLGILLYGTISFERLGTDLMPDIKNPKVAIALRSGDKSPEEMEDSYAEKIEGLISTIPKVRRVSSVSRVGQTLVTAEFGWEADMDFALLDVQKQVGRIQNDREVDELLVAKYDPQAAPIMTVAVVGDTRQDLDELRRIAENTLKKNLERLEGVAAARVAGGRMREAVVRIDPYLLKAYGLTLAEVKQRIQAANIDASGGRVDDRDKTYVVSGKGQFADLEEIRNVVVGYRAAIPERERAGSVRVSADRVPVRLSEVAQVAYEYKEPESIVRLDGRECVGIFIYKEARSNTVNVVELVKQSLRSLQENLPAIDLVVATDQSGFITSAIGQVKGAAVQGTILALAVLYLFLRNIWPTVIVGLAIPISIVATFNLMYFAGLTLNIMSLGGLALGVGMLVDNAIVVMENVFRHRLLGKEARQAASFGASEVVGAIVGSTVTTVVVFLPIVFVKGMAGQLFKEQAMTVSFSLLSSLVVAIFLIPMLASRFLAKKNVGQASLKGIRVYERGLRWALGHRLWVLVAVAAMVALAGVLLPRIGNEFIPKTDQGQFTLKLRLPEGTRIENTDIMVKRVEEILSGVAEQLKNNSPAAPDLLGRAKSLLARVGLGSQASAGGPGSPIQHVFSTIGQIEDERTLFEAEQADSNTAVMEMVLSSEATRNVSSSQLVALLDPYLRSIPGLEVSYLLQETVLQQTVGTGGAPVQVEVKGPDLGQLRSISTEVARKLSELPSVYNVRTNFQEGRPEVRVRLDRLLAGSFGLDIRNVADQVKRRVSGEVVGKFETAEDDRDIELKFEESTLDELRSLEIDNPQGALLTLSDVANLEIVEGAREILRRDQTRVGLVAANTAGGARFSDVMSGVRQAVTTVSVPARYSISVGGEEQERRESFDSLKFALALSLILVYMVMAAEFESFIHPFIIMFTVPLAGIGTVLTFYLLGMPFSIMAYIGVIMLGGIVVNNAIILVDYTNTLRSSGIGDMEAVVEGAKTRLRPILMTSLTTILGLLPLALGMSEEAKLRAPLAIAVMSGLTTATFLTLFVIPVLYSFTSGKETTKSTKDTR